MDPELILLRWYGKSVGRLLIEEETSYHAEYIIGPTARWQKSYISASEGQMHHPSQYEVRAKIKIREQIRQSALLRQRQHLARLRRQRLIRAARHFLHAAALHIVHRLRQPFTAKSLTVPRQNGQAVDGRPSSTPADSQKSATWSL